MANQSPTVYRPGSPEPFSPTSPFLAFYRQANHLFEAAFRELEDVRETFGGVLAPNIDVTQNDREIRITAELPGVKEEDIDIEIEHDVLTIRAEKRVEREQGRGLHHMSERAFGTFQRSLKLPRPVAAGQVHAHFDHGVLTLLLPRMAQESDRHHIAIESGPPPEPATDGKTETPH